MRMLVFERCHKENSYKQRSCCIQYDGVGICYENVDRQVCVLWERALGGSRRRIYEVKSTFSFDPVYRIADQSGRVVLIADTGTLVCVFVNSDEMANKYPISE